MNVLKTAICILSFAFMAVSLQAQVTDDININASFSSSIDLTVTDGANISFNVATLADYQNGLEDPSSYSSKFEVNSSVNFKVDLSSTPFDDGNGNILNANNFGYTLIDNGTYSAGTNHKLVGGTTSPSGYALLGTPTEIITATGSGNAGSAAANAFIIKFELGTAAVRAISGLSNLLDQNIAPATYASTVTLTATGTP